MKSKKNAIFVFVSLLLVASLVGCAKPTDAASEEPANTSEVVSEEVTEEPSEEVSEEVTEEASEKATVGEFYFSSRDEMEEYIMSIGETRFADYNFSDEDESQLVFANGSKCLLKASYFLRIFTTKEISEIIPYAEVEVFKSNIRDVPSWSLIFHDAVTDLEVPFTIKYVDGTEEEILLYVTVLEEVFVEEEEEEEEEEVFTGIDITEFTVKDGKDIRDLVDAMKYEELKIVVWNYEVGAKALLSNSDSYVEQKGEGILLVYHKPVKEVKITNGEIITEVEGYCRIKPSQSEDVVELICEVTAEDGTKETITVNITPYKE